MGHAAPSICQQCSIGYHQPGRALWRTAPYRNPLQRVPLTITPLQRVARYGYVNLKDRPRRFGLSVVATLYYFPQRRAGDGARVCSAPVGRK